MIKRICAIGLIAVFLFSGTGVAGTLRKEFTKRIDFQPGGHIRVGNINGKVEVLPWKNNEVEIYAEIEVRSGNRRTAEEAMEELEIDVRQDGDALTVEARYPKSQSGGFFDWVFGRKAEIRIDFMVHVPERSDLNLKTTNGAIEVSGIEGQVKLRTTNGNIDAEDLGGALDAHTVNGSIDAALNALNRDEEHSFSTTNGSITITLPGDINADVRVSTVNGRISTDFPLQVKGKFNSKSMTGTIGSGGAMMIMKTVNGSIHLQEE